MEPAVIFVVAGIVGTIVVSLYLPMFSLIRIWAINHRQQSGVHPILDDISRGGVIHY